MLELIIGGARSGKSHYALEAAEDVSGRHIFIATATAGDDEMAKRISQHKAERSAQWQLIEEPFHLAARISLFEKGDVLLVDCLTLWLSNWLGSSQEDQWVIEQDHFFQALSKSSSIIFLVSNEVGMGIVPMDKLSRKFVDNSGKLHQQIAHLADKVTQVTAGIPIRIK